MKKFIVGIPSYNEVKRIGFVTQQIDRGLTKLYSPNDCLIVNVDGHSPDNTKMAFLNTKTKCAKEYIIVSKGKGYGLIKFWEFVLSENVEGVATIDADIKSITPEWVEKLLQPIVSKKYDIVSPAYTRNRFAGGITNHFAYPLIYSVYGVRIRQPLAGDYGYSPSFVKYLLQQDKFRTIFQYGIDFFITASALHGCFKMLNRELGRKIDKPGFAHQKRMFLEVTQSAIFVTKNHLLNWNYINCDKSSVVYAGNALGIDKIESFPHKRSMPHLFKRLRENFEKNKKYNKIFLKDIYHIVKEVIYYDDMEFSSELWTDILSRLLLIVYSSNFSVRDIPIISSILLPLYRRRIISFWFSIEGIDPNEVEKRINQQAELLYKKLNREKMFIKLKERRINMYENTRA